MKVTGSLKCSECAEPILGSADLLPGCARMTVDPDGVFDWAGGTELFWDAQFNRAQDPTKLLVQCCNGHEWLVEFEEP